MKPKRVVAYGCSYTAGEETGDHEVYKIDEEELDKLKRTRYSLEAPSDEYIQFKKKFLKEKYKGNLFDLNAELTSIGKTYSYVRYLSDLLELPYSNRAVPGGAMGQIVFRLERDLYHNAIEDRDLVLIGLTTPNRFFRITEHIRDETIFYTENSGVIGSSTIMNQKETEFLLKWDFNKMQIFWNYYVQVRHLLILAEKYKDKCKIVLIPILCSFETEIDIALNDFDHNNRVDKSVKSLFNMYREIIQHPNYLHNCHTIPFYNDFILNNRNTQNLIHGRRHPKKELHQKYAEYLYTNYKKEILENK